MLLGRSFTCAFSVAALLASGAARAEGSCDLLLPQKLGQCEPAVPSDGQMINCTGEAELSLNVTAPHVRNCEMRFTPPIVEAITTDIRIIASEAPNATPRYVTLNFFKAENGEIGQTQVVIGTASPSPNGLSGSEKIRIAYVIGGKVRLLKPSK